MKLQKLQQKKVNKQEDKMEEQMFIGKNEGFTRTCGALFFRWDLSLTVTRFGTNSKR